MQAFEDRYNVPIDAGMGHDRNLAAGYRRAQLWKRDPCVGDESQGRPMCGVEIPVCGVTTTIRRPCRGTVRSVGEIQARGPWIPAPAPWRK